MRTDSREFPIESALERLLKNGVRTCPGVHVLNFPLAGQFAQRRPFERVLASSIGKKFYGRVCSQEALTAPIAEVLTMQRSSWLIFRRA
jgi:hypothetical protein